MKKINAYLLDDDETILKIWDINSKKISSIQLHTFTHLDQIKNEKLQEPNLLFIDVKLGDHSLTTGDISDLKEKGFKDIYLVTGYKESDLPKDLLDLVLGVLGKEFPKDLLSSRLSLHE